MMEWRPIATAPKDGTLVDLWVDGARMPDCRYEADNDESLGGLNGWHHKYAETTDCYTWVDGDDFKPTHWMKVEPPGGAPCSP
jgi:hypothetical protein